MGKLAAVVVVFVNALAFVGVAIAVGILTWVHDDTLLGGSWMATVGTWFLPILAIIVMTLAFAMGREDRQDRRPGLFAAIHGSFPAIVFATCTWHALFHTMIGDRASKEGESTAVIASFAIGPSLTAVLAWWLVSRFDRGWDRALRHIALGITVLSSVILALSMHRAGHLFDAEHYTIPIVWRLPSATAPHMESESGTYKASRPFMTDRVGPFRVDRFQVYFPAGSARRDGCSTELYAIDLGADAHLLTTVAGCPGVTFGHEQAADLWSVNLLSKLYSSASGEVDLHSVSVLDMARSLSPPYGWIDGAKIGWVYAVSAQAVGWLTLAMSCFVFTRSRKNRALRPDYVRRADAVATALSAYALACLLITSVPLYGAALAGFVF